MNAASGQPVPQGAPQSDEALLDRALGPRPDFESAYTVLGKQYSIDKWVAVLKNLARHAQGADLEAVAHSTLRRPPAVITAVLDLARAKGTTQSAFLARVIAQARDEEQLVVEANVLNAEIRKAFDLDMQLAAGDAWGSLYYLLAGSLEEQAEELRRLSPDPAFAELAETIRSEYERLQEVSKDTSWRSGSYRHVLRHSLADMALVARIGGHVEDKAFRLLQVRTDDFAATRELLALLDDDVRRRYLAWALERASVDSSPERAVGSDVSHTWRSCPLTAAPSIRSSIHVSGRLSARNAVRR